jgi:hypothetical protein
MNLKLSNLSTESNVVAFCHAIKKSASYEIDREFRVGL